MVQHTRESQLEWEIIWIVLFPVFLYGPYPVDCFFLTWHFLGLFIFTMTTLDLLHASVSMCWCTRLGVTSVLRNRIGHFLRVLFEVFYAMCVCNQFDKAKHHFTHHLLQYLRWLHSSNYYAPYVHRCHRWFFFTTYQKTQRFWLGILKINWCHVRLLHQKTCLLVNLPFYVILSCVRVNRLLRYLWRQQSTHCDLG